MNTQGYLEEVKRRATVSNVIILEVLSVLFYIVEAYRNFQQTTFDLIKIFCNDKNRLKCYILRSLIVLVVSLTFQIIKHLAQVCLDEGDFLLQHFS